jgi:hypothetical protein
VAANLVFVTPIVQTLSGNKNPLASHAGKTIRDQIFWILQTVPSEGACTSKYSIKTNQKSNVFSKRQKYTKTKTHISVFEL